MPVEMIEKYTWYKINRDGRIECTSKGSQKGHEYDAIWGTLIGIERVADVWEGETYYMYRLLLRNPQDGAVEVLQFRESGSAARGILFSLYSIEGDIHQVRFAPYRNEYEGKTYTNVAVQYRRADSSTWEKTPEWPSQLTDNLPAVQEIRMSNGKKVLDDGDRMKYIAGLAARIKKTKIANLMDPAQPGKSNQPDNSEQDEIVDPDTGEVISMNPGAMKAVYDPPAPALPDLPADFDDLDDDLPF